MTSYRLYNENELCTSFFKWRDAYRGRMGRHNRHETQHYFGKNETWMG